METDKQMRFGRLRSVFLLVALLALILTVPLRATEGDASLTSQMLNTAVFCVAGYLLAMTRKWVFAYLALAIPTFVIGVITTSYPDYSHLDLARDILTLILQCVLIYAVLKFSLLNKKAGALDRVVAGICGYLILALLWTDLYMIVEHFSEGAIRHSDGTPAEAGDGSIVYFSFVTLTTLGYGDIAPTTPLTRILAAMEAVTGTLYLAILIASLLSELRRERA